VSRNPRLSSIEGLSGLERVPGDVVLAGNEALARLVGLRNVASVGGNFSISVYDDGEVGPLYNAALTDLSGLDRLASVGGRLSVGSNPALRTVDGLGSLVSVGELRFAENDELSSLRALAALQTIQAGFYIRYNESLATCEADWLRDSVGTTNIGGPVDISGNDDAGVCPAL
jgi:hypothetical protein